MAAISGRGWMVPISLLAYTTEMRQVLRDHGITGRDGAEIDHIEVFGPPSRSDADSRNFVLCPGSAYDRSPCGTGTSAKMAVLRTRGKLGFGEEWRQESITGSLFSAWLEHRGENWIPHVRGEAHITARSTLIFHPNDPFRFGLR